MLKSTCSVKDNKIASIQSLRACAFLTVFILHLEGATIGVWGVSVFFILSGFIMFYAYRNRNLESGFEKNILFALRKIKKLYLLHIITMILAVVIEVYMYFDYIAPNNVRDIYERIVLNTFLMQSWMPDQNIFFSLNGVSWYLSTSLFLYFMFPYIINRVKKYNSIFESFIKIAMILSVQILVGIILGRLNATEEIAKWVTYIMPIYRIGDFYIGMVIGYIFINKKCLFDSLSKPYFGIFISAVEVLILVLTVIANKIYDDSIGVPGSIYFKFTLLYTPLSTMAVYLFALNKGIISKLLTNKLVIYIGEISGFAFITHFIIIRYYNEFLYNKHFILSNSWTRFVICLGFTILVSHILNDLSIRKNITKNSTVCRI